MKPWAQTLKVWLDLFLETSCPLCQRSTPTLFCQDCQRQLQRCRLSNPQQLWQPPLPVFAWGSYGGSLKRSIALLKYSQQPQIAQPLGHWLAEAWLQAPCSSTPLPLTVVAVPMHAAKQQQRGYNQAELLAESFCERTHLPLQRQALERVKATTAQFGLSAADRTQNLADAFRPGPGLAKIPGRRAILLLDDIYTTGATARAAMQALVQARRQVYGCAVIAQPQSER